MLFRSVSQSRYERSYRPRDNPEMRKFMKEASVGDVICLTKVEERVFKVTLIKR